VFVAVNDCAATVDNPARAWLGGIAALARTVATEWPQVAVKSIDCEVRGQEPGAVAEAIVAELLTGGGTAEVGLRADGTRVVPELVDAPIGTLRPRIGPQSLVVVSGGARGVTAAAVRLLASRYRPRLVLLGRTPLEPEPDGLSAGTDEAGLIRLLTRLRPGTPAELSARARKVLAGREIRETLDAIERSGASVRYVPVDVRDTAAVTETLANVRRDWGPITAVVHGAGVLADARIVDKTGEQFDRVFDTKVEGLRALLAATREDPLEVLCVFSSVAAVFGNAGQSDYAMANEVLNRVLVAERADRTGCLVRAIAWGPWEGGMVTPSLAGRFRGSGVPLIEPADGAHAFLDELGGSPDEVLVVRTADGDLPAGDGLAAQVTVVEPAYSHLADHRLGGVPVVPIATVLDWFAGAARAWRPRASQLILRDVRVLGKISLPGLANGGHRLILRGHQATAEDGPALDLDLRDEGGRPRYRASVATVPLNPTGTWLAPGDLVPLDHPYDGTPLFHGTAFQAIRGTPGVSPQGAEGIVAGCRALGWDTASGQLDPGALDGCLQLALLWARQAGVGHTLPMGVRECRVYRLGTLEAEARCVVRAVRVGEEGGTCDVALIDADGQPRVELAGVELVRRPGQ
jgi:NAD(P)-dependent dehydrogenase (short-subunit alcohol dehydrogenase family)